MLALLLAAACSNWTGVQDATFDDPYIQALETESPGWLSRMGLLRRYAAVDRAFRLEAEGRLEEAASEIAKHLELEPRDIRVRAYYLTLLTELGRQAQVLEQANRILDAEPGYVPALLARGRIRRSEGRLEAAAADFMSAAAAPGVLPADRTAAQENAIDCSLEWAAALEADGEPARAAAAYRQALGLPVGTEQRIQALRGLSRTAHALDRLAEAREAAEAATRLAPDRSDLRIDAAGLALADEDFDAAADHLEAAIARGAPTPESRREALDQLAVAYERSGRPLAAAARVEQLIRLTPGDPERAALHARAGELNLAADRPVRAAQHLATAAELDTSARGAELYRRAARLYARGGRPIEAVATLRAALAAYPDSEAIRAELRNALVVAGGLDGPVAGAGQAQGQSSPGGLSAGELTASRLAFAGAYEDTGRIENAIALYRQVADAEPEGSRGWTLAVQRLAALLARQEQWRASADRLMALHRAGASQGTGANSDWALQAANRYATANAWIEAAAAYEAAGAAGLLPPAEAARRQGIALVEAGRPDRAEAAFSSIPAAERTHQDSRYLASLAAARGDSTRAARFYEAAVRSAPTRADSAAALRAAGYLQLGRDDARAATLLQRALVLNDDPGLRLDLARVQLRLGQPDAARLTLDDVDADGWSPTRRLDRLDQLATIHSDRADTAAIITVLEEAAALEPSAYRLNRLGFFYEFAGRFDEAAATFEQAYDVHPTATQAEQVAYVHRRLGDDLRAAEWFRRAVDVAGSDRTGAGAAELYAARRQIGLLTDRISAAAYVSLRGGGGAGLLPPSGTQHAGIGSQGGVQLQYRPLAGRVAWGRDLELLGRLFWGFEDGVHLDADSYQGQVGLRYRPRWVPGSAVGLERWVGLGAAALDTWALRMQLSGFLGSPYPGLEGRAVGYASLYGDAAYLFRDGGGYTLFGEARPGVSVPLSQNLALLPHGTLSAYRQSLAGATRTYVEGGPGLGLRLQVPVAGRYATELWAFELMAQYRWGGTFGDPSPAERYDELVLTLVLQL